jgi:hypothetical protein
MPVPPAATRDGVSSAARPLRRGDRLPDFRAPLADGSSFSLSDDAGGLPVVFSVGPPLGIDAHGVVLHVPLTTDDRAPSGLSLLDDGSLAHALTGGVPGVVVAGSDHRVFATGAVADADALVAMLGQPLEPVVRSTSVPIAIVRDVFDPELCARLIEHAAEHGMHPSPMVRPSAAGEAVLIVDEGAKARLDHLVEDLALRDEVASALAARLLPEIVRSFSLHPTAFEVPKIVRYEADHGWFRPHRDNTTPDAAHRRLAVTVNLDDEYCGGNLAFLELTVDHFRPPVGAAIVFSCAQLHELTAVTAGQRHALITFVW